MQPLFDRVQEMVREIDAGKLLQDALGSLTGVVVGLILAYLVFFRHWWRFWTGDSDTILFQAHYLIPSGDRVVLAFRTVAPPTTIKKCYENQAAQRSIRQLARATTIDQPIIRPQGPAGTELIVELLNQISGSMAVSSHPRQTWLLAATCEDRRVAPKKCIRVFLIRPDDLEKFRDWAWCQEKLLIQSPWHFFRILALHHLALKQDAKEKDVAVAGKTTRREMFAGRAEAKAVHRVSLGLPDSEVLVGAPIQPDWPRVAKYLEAIGHRLPSA